MGSEQRPAHQIVHGGEEGVGVIVLVLLAQAQQVPGVEARERLQGAQNGRGGQPHAQERGCDHAGA